ncbi:MAG: SsrA-binding protein SmpB [Candidatus Paceibacterota bacterium]|jgi:SsrA-binding protein
MALAENKKAFYDYEILESFEAGIELLGLEVKSLRAHGATLEGAHVIIRGGEGFLIQLNIPPYQVANTPKDYDPLRVRKLLLNKAELNKLANLEAGRGLTIVPIKVYNKGRVVKVDIAVARGKKEFDKRQSIKRRESDRESQRTLKYE